MRLSKLWRNWRVHNILAHPLMEVILLCTGRSDWATWVHDTTVPEKGSEEA